MNVSDFLLGSIPLLLQFYAEMYRETDFKDTMLELESEFNVPKTKTYDIIVVGAGSAGCVVAGRLSEYFNVLLLEAGGTPPPAVTVPYFAAAVGRDPSINYFFQSVPQTNASLCCDGITRISTGKMLGGSGSHNDMIHSRGSPGDYDNWATLLNDDSFNYSNVLKYFKKLETFIGHRFGAEVDEYYGHDGPILVNTSLVPILDLWQEAGLELGYPIGDPNGFQREGCIIEKMDGRGVVESCTQACTFKIGTIVCKVYGSGQRSSSYVEYIKPYEESRNNLTVIRYANVSEILVDDDKRAYGVAYTRHGIPQIAYAEKEIILSAGTFSSPLLLMKSGIGPEDILNAAEIPVKVPLEAVGKNLGEHPLFLMTGLTVNDSSVFLKINSEDIENILEEYHNGEGVLTKTTQARCMITSSRANTDWPDIWIEIHPMISIDGIEVLNFYNFLGRPKSKGILTIDTDKYKAGVRDDAELALIDFKLLTHPDDIETMLEGVKFIFKIIETDAFKRINLTYNVRPDPVCDALTIFSDDYWRCKFQQDTRAISHIVGTCSMGPDSGNSGAFVVDTQFRVRGVSNLRVVDASVIPEITNANINAPIMMLAEKAAENIINFYNGPAAST